MLFRLFFVLFFSISLKARVWLAQSLFCSLKNRTMAPLQFLYSVSSLRHLPSSAVKNGTDVACFHFRKWHQTQICKVNDCTQEINPENEIWGLITLYLFREVYLTSVESWNLPYFPSCCAHLALSVMVCFLFSLKLWGTQILKDKDHANCTGCAVKAILFNFFLQPWCASFFSP